MGSIILRGRLVLPGEAPSIKAASSKVEGMLREKTDQQVDGKGHGGNGVEPDNARVSVHQGNLLHDQIEGM